MGLKMMTADAFYLTFGPFRVVRHLHIVWGRQLLWTCTDKSCQPLWVDVFAPNSYRNFFGNYPMRNYPPKYPKHTISSVSKYKSIRLKHYLFTTKNTATTGLKCAIKNATCLPCYCYYETKLEMCVFGFWSSEAQSWERCLKECTGNWNAYWFLQCNDAKTENI